MQTQNANQNTKVIANGTFERMLHNLHIEPIATYNYLAMGRNESTYTLYRDFESLEYYLQYKTKSGTALTTLISPQYAKDLIAEFEQSMNKDSLVGSYYTLNGEYYNFKKIIEEDIQKGNTVDLANRAESLMNTIYNYDIYVVNADPDNMLADVLGNDYNVQAGATQNILNLYKDHSNRLAVEQMFKTLTGVEFKDYLSDSIDKMEAAIQEYDESMSKA